MILWCEYWKIISVGIKKTAFHIHSLLSTLFLIHCELLNLMAAVSTYGTWKLLCLLLCMNRVGWTPTTPAMDNKLGGKPYFRFWDWSSPMTNLTTLTKICIDWWYKLMYSLMSRSIPMINKATELNWKKKTLSATQYTLMTLKCAGLTTDYLLYLTSVIL